MLDKLFPRALDNNYRGTTASLWAFGLVVAVRLLQSTFIIFNAHQTVTQADGVPLDTYPAAAAQTIVNLFVLTSIWRALVCLLGLLVLVRYRSAVPLMFVIFILNFLGAQLLSQFLPLVRIGTPPGPIVNLVLFALMLVGLALSLWDRRAGV